jgi:hypothetical protein
MGLGHLKCFFSITTESILTSLITSHPGRKGIQVCSNEGGRPSPRGRKSKSTLKFFENLLLQNHMVKFNQTWNKLSLDLGNGN